ncbi:MAG: hypothetical protein ACYC5O_01710 [Anaerolineae bacterium]
MTDLLHLDPESYRVYILASARKHLLVEGRQDRRAFLALQDEYAVHLGEGARDAFDIDTAENLRGFGDGVGNREKVESVLASTASRPYAAKLVGFVDRELRGFECNGEARDAIGGHHQQGRLVWSRGHSLESYCLDFRLLRRPLRAFSPTDHFDKALKLLQRLLPQLLLVGCALTLAGNRTRLMRITRGSVSWEVLGLSNGGVLLDTENWLARLKRLQKLDPCRAGQLVTAYISCWSTLSGSPHEVLRWMCDGHLGLALVWAAYGRCVYEVCGSMEEQARRNEVQRVLMTEENARLNACVDSWAQGALEGTSEYPRCVFELLGLHQPAERPADSAC